jgi:hypothetical protein
MLWLKIALTIAAAYVIVVALMAALQGRLIFPTYIANAQAPLLPPDARRLALTPAGGERLAGTHLPPLAGAKPEAGRGDGGTLILGFGGNATDAGVVALMLRDLYPASHVVAFHYRGYGESAGRPSARALLSDSLAVHDAAVAAIRPKRVIAIGFSVGAGVAAYLARHRALAGLVLVTPFDSIEAVARSHYPWAPVGLLLRHRMPTVRYLEGRPTPTALIAAGRDRIVPANHTAALRPAIGNLVLDRTVPGVGHNGIYGHPAFTAAMTEALAGFPPAP